MTARAAAIVVALALHPVQLHAQDIVFTVSVSSANVHKGPSIVTPVIAHVPQGTALPVVRNLGSWVKVEWRAAPDGFGYLHVSTGQLTPASISSATPRASSTTAALASPGPASAPLSPSSSPTGHAARPPRPRERVVLGNQQGATAISHIVGVGALLGSMSSAGATTRAWRDNRLGLQIGFTRDAMTSSVAAGRVTSVQLEPAVVYGLFDHVSDYFWVRPYIGSGLSIRHQTLHDTTPSGADAAASTGVGFRAFGGGEVTFAGAPRFGLSVDVGYRWLPTPFPGFEPASVSAIVAGHWYVK
jgi:hypothetical protein